MNLRLMMWLGIGLAFALLLGWALRVDALRANWKLRFEGLTKEAGVVLAVTRRESGNRRLAWRGTAEQIELLGAAKRQWQEVARDQSNRIAELGTETTRLRQLGEAERLKAERAIAQRNNALSRLERQALTPGDREDCEAQLRSAQEALDLVFEEGL